MKLTYQAIGENGDLEQVIVNCDSDTLGFVINGNPISINDDRKKIELNARNYLNEGSSGENYTERPFFKYFNNNISGNEILEDIIRIIGITSTFLHFDGMPRTTDEYRRNSIEKFLLGWLGIDWTGKEEVQPQFYFLSKALLDSEKDELEKLYQNRFLHKVYAELDKELTLYYLPIHYPDPDFFDFGSAKHVWKKIVKEVNQEVLRLTQGRFE